MIVKFFKSCSSGSSGKASIDYLLNAKKHGGEENIQVLQGDPGLSLSLTENLTFKHRYDVGCLSFEEEPHKITDQQKKEIMERFEATIFAGLDKDQYNILWVEHTDKERLELNFFIPKVELTSGKQLTPYFDKADRPLMENFKQVINHEYNLSDPNDPAKKQTLITSERLPKAKKEALKAINDGIKGLYRAGAINDRSDVLRALEGAGFEIARVTPKNISIKTDGQNLRLKGAFYEQSFRRGETIREEIERASSDYQRERGERYKTARERLNQAITRREREFKKRYPNRASEISRKIEKDLQGHQHSDIGHIRNNHHRIDDIHKNTIRQGDGLETVSGKIRQSQQLHQHELLPNQQRHSSIMRRDRSDLQGKDVGRWFEKLRDTTKQKRELADGNANRKAFTANLDRIIHPIREIYTSLIEKIRRNRAGKRIDQGIISQHRATEQRNQRAISHVKQLNQSLKPLVQAKERQVRRSSGFSL